jgi:outer membrane protein OmpA-like peptidoglycan-associated protein
MANEPVGARARGIGAVARGDGAKRRGGWWWWLIATLLLLAVIAGGLIALLSGGSHHANRLAAHHGATVVPPSPTTGAAGQAAAVASGQSTPAAGGVSGTGGPAAAGQVGGDGIAATTATGRLAAAGSVGVILFAEAGTGLDRPADTVIATAAKEITARKSRRVTVIGYTDSIGNARANQTLSLERGRRVVAALRQQLGSTTTTFVAEARGQTHPVAPNTTAAGRQLDRRVEIFVNP